MAGRECPLTANPGSTEQGTVLWTAATTDAGPEGDRARLLIEQVTDIRITVKAG